MSVVFIELDEVYAYPGGIMAPVTHPELPPPPLRLRPPPLDRPRGIDLGTRGDMRVVKVSEAKYWSGVHVSKFIDMMLLPSIYGVSPLPALGRSRIHVAQELQQLQCGSLCVASDGRPARFSLLSVCGALS
jgi:hypothetical protein